MSLLLSLSLLSRWGSMPVTAGLAFLSFNSKMRLSYKDKSGKEQSEARGRTKRILVENPAVDSALEEQSWRAGPLVGRAGVWRRRSPGRRASHRRINTFPHPVPQMPDVFISLFFINKKAGIRYWGKTLKDQRSSHQ